MTKPISWHVCFNVLHQVFRRFTTLACCQEKEGCNINRHYYDLEEIEREVQRPVVQSLFNLLKFRNTSAAFDGEFAVDMEDANTIHIS